MHKCKYGTSDERNEINEMHYIAMKILDLKMAAVLEIK